MNIADSIHEASCRAIRIELDLLEQMIAAFVAETGQTAMLCSGSVAGRQWLQPDPGGDVVRATGHGKRLAELAARYHATTDVPASEAVLVRERDGTRILWRFERRA